MAGEKDPRYHGLRWDAPNSRLVINVAGNDIGYFSASGLNVLGSQVGGQQAPAAGKDPRYHGFRWDAQNARLWVNVAGNDIGYFDASGLNVLGAQVGGIQAPTVSKDPRYHGLRWDAANARLVVNVAGNDIGYFNASGLNVLGALVPGGSYVPLPVWEDTFSSIISTIWDNIATLGTITPQNGYAYFTGQINAWQNGAALWSPQYSPSVVGAVMFTARIAGTSSQWGVFLNNSQNPAAPNGAAGGGVIFSRAGGDPTWFIDTAVAVPVGNSIQGTQSLIANYVRSIDYTVILVPRPGGGLWVLVSGGAYGAWPICTILAVDLNPALVSWVTPSGGFVFDGTASNSTAKLFYARGLPTALMPTELTTAQGLCIAADNFTGGATISGRSLQVGGGSWTISGAGVTGGTAGSVAISGSGTFRYIQTTLPSSAQWLVYDVQLAATDGTSRFALYFRKGSQQWIVLVNANNAGGANNHITLLDYYPSGVAIEVTSGVISASLANTTYRLAILDTGSEMTVYWRGAKVFTTTAHMTDGAGQLGVLISNWSSTSDVSIMNFEAYPATYSVPTNWLGSSVRPVIDAKATFYGPDNFPGSSLNVAWKVQNGPINGNTISNAWTVSGATASPTGGGVRAALLQNVGSANHGVSVQTEHTGTLPSDDNNDIGNAIILRAVDSGNGQCNGIDLIFSRLLWQGSAASPSPEIELWQIANGSTKAQTYVPLGAGGIANTTVYTLEGYVNGSDICIYLTYPSGVRELVIQDSVVDSRLLTGTMCGIAALDVAPIGTVLFTAATLSTT